MGRANGHGRGVRRHCHRSLVRQAVGQESLRGQAEDRCRGILVLFAERLEARRGGSWPVTDLIDDVENAIHEQARMAPT